jgi:xeroderma pigmentosum group C-complementing protein
LRVERPSYPVFWVEAFNSAHQKWVAVDPMATHTVGKPSRLEPGINDPKNCMTYVIAFEEDGVARDVTRRYTKAFTAKTRKLRVEYTENGTSWLRKAMKLFRRPRVADRDALEDAELTAKAAQEGMPKNVQDFKNHPLYALGRHLRRNEIIHPKQESGRINAGTANNPKFESVYRRANVHIVKSADKWFRLGREIKMGEQPMKHAMPRRGTRVRESPLDPEVVEEVGVGLYAAFQTQVYVPPAVGDDGKIPKNQYGNIDIYVPSMIPSGAVWIRMPEAKHAAKLLRIDYADAVTGFDFKGRHGTARMDGVVVAEEFFEAMEIACGGIREGRVEEIEAERRREALRLWRKFMVGLREVERIEGYLRRDEVPSDGPEDNQGQSTEQDGNGDGGGGGGFVVEADDAPMSPPVRRTRPQRAQKVNEESAGGFPADSGDESDGGGGFLADSSDDDGDSGGGFMPEEETVTEDDIDDGEDDNQGDGGFLPDAGADEARADHDGEREEGTTGNNEVMVPDDTPFGFASIRIPELSRAMLYRDEESGATPLPHVIRGMRRREEQPEASQHVLAFDQAGAELSHVVLDKAIADFEIVSQLKDDKMVDAPTLAAEPAIQQAVDEPLPDGERPLVDATMAPLEISRPAEKKIAPPKQEKEEPPMSSYEYDDDMLDEDPEDEDAEPEWIV